MQPSSINPSRKPDSLTTGSAQPATNPKLFNKRAVEVAHSTDKSDQARASSTPPSMDAFSHNLPSRKVQLHIAIEKGIANLEEIKDLIGKIKTNFSSADANKMLAPRLYTAMRATPPNLEVIKLLVDAINDQEALTTHLRIALEATPPNKDLVKLLAGALKDDVYLARSLLNVLKTSYSNQNNVELLKQAVSDQKLWVRGLLLACAQSPIEHTCFQDELKQIGEQMLISCLNKLFKEDKISKFEAKDILKIITDQDKLNELLQIALAENVDKELFRSLAESLDPANLIQFIENINQSGYDFSPELTHIAYKLLEHTHENEVVKDFLKELILNRIANSHSGDDHTDFINQLTLIINDKEVYKELLGSAFSQHLVNASIIQALLVLQEGLLDKALMNTLEASFADKSIPNSILKAFLKRQYPFVKEETLKNACNADLISMATRGIVPNDEQSNKSLIHAIQDNNIEEINSLLEQPNNSNAATLAYALKAACEPTRNDTVVKLLITHANFDPNIWIQGQYAITTPLAYLVVSMVSNKDTSSLETLLAQENIDSEILNHSLLAATRYIKYGLDAQTVALLLNKIPNTLIYPSGLSSVNVTMPLGIATYSYLPQNKAQNLVLNHKKFKAEISLRMLGSCFNGIPGVLSGKLTAHTSKCPALQVLKEVVEGENYTGLSMHIIKQNLASFLNTKKIKMSDHIRNTLAALNLENVADPNQIHTSILEGKPSSFFLNYPAHVMCANISQTVVLGLTNLGAYLDLNDGQFKNRLRRGPDAQGRQVAPGTRYFSLASGKNPQNILTKEFIENLITLKSRSTFIAEQLYQSENFVDLGFIETEGQLVGNCGFLHPQQCILEHILFGSCSTIEQLKQLIDNWGSHHNLSPLQNHAIDICNKFTLFVQVEAFLAFKGNKQAIRELFSQEDDEVINFVSDTLTQMENSCQEKLIGEIEKFVLDTEFYNYIITRLT